MKKLIMILCSIAVVGCGNEPKQQETHQHPAASTETSTAAKSLSPHTSAMAMINGAHIHIDYSAPSVRDRIIFGGLVGYNTVWQAGAHNATWIEIDKDLEINKKILPAGKYGFFVIPGKEAWQVMFNSRWEQHGKDQYSEAENILTLEVIPQNLKEIQESLIYEVNQTAVGEGEISMAWEKVKIQIPFKVNANG